MTCAILDFDMNDFSSTQRAALAERLLRLAQQQVPPAEMEALARLAELRNPAMPVVKRPSGTPTIPTPGCVRSCRTGGSTPRTP